MSNNVEAIPIANPLSIGSTLRSAINELGVREVEEIIPPTVTIEIYLTRLLQLVTSDWQYPLVADPEKQAQFSNVWKWNEWNNQIKIIYANLGRSNRSQWIILRATSIARWKVGCLRVRSTNWCIDTCWTSTVSITSRFKRESVWKDKHLINNPRV